MQDQDGQSTDDRRTRTRRDGEPLRWQEIALRRDWETLPFLHYFDELNNPTPQR